MDMKLPSGSAAGKISRLLSSGFIQPFGRLLADHDWRSACAFWIAAVRVLGQSRKILRSARQCGAKGAHYLDV
jgi:hypothetical protein